MTELMLEEMATHLEEPTSRRTAELRRSRTVRTQRTNKRRRATTSTYQGGISRRRNKRWSW